MQTISVKEQHRTSLRKLGMTMLILGAVLVVLAAFLPTYVFDVSLYLKKSGNTFPGDERYTAAMAEAEEQLVLLKEQTGNESLVITEEQLLRTNAFGKQNSIMTFSIRQPVELGLIQLALSPLPTGRVLLLSLILLCAGAAAVALTIRERRSSQDRGMPRNILRIRRVACWVLLMALILVPLFYFSTVQMTQRQLLTAMDRNTADPAVVSAYDQALLAGKGGDQAAEYLKGMTHEGAAGLYVAGLGMTILLLGALLISEGTLAVALRRGLLYFFVISLCVVILYPYYVMIITGFRDNAETTDMYFQHIAPATWVWSNLPDIIDRHILRYLANSLLLSAGSTTIALLCGIPAAYAMARMKFRGRGFFLGFVIMSQMFAPVVLLVGITRLMNFLRLNDSLVGLMLINAAFNQAFSIWLLRGTFVAISPEMEQAATIDGCGTVSALIRVLLPVAAPGIVTTLIFVFIAAWNEYTIATVLISTPILRPITVGITQFSSFNMIQWHYLFAAAVLATIPVVILFMFIEKHLVSGLTAGGVKG